MKPIIPWTVAGNVDMDKLAIRFLEIVELLLKPSTYEKMKPLPDSTINALCIKMFKNLAPEGFTFGFHNQTWSFHHEVTTPIS